VVLANEARCLLSSVLWVMKALPETIGGQSTGSRVSMALNGLASGGRIPRLIQGTSPRDAGLGHMTLVHYQGRDEWLVDYV